MLLKSTFFLLFCACTGPTSTADAYERVTLCAIIGANKILFCRLASTLFVALSRDAGILA